MFRLHSRTGHRRHLLLGAATVATLLAVAASAQAAPFVYVTNELSGTVSQFNARAGGLLAPLVPATVAAPTRPLGVAVSPDGQSVYVANHDSTGVSQYDVGAGGRLSPKSPAKVAADGATDEVAVSPDGQSVYVTNILNGSVSQYDVGAGGQLSPKSPATVAAGVIPRVVAVSPDGQSVYVTNGVSDTVSQYDVDAGGRLSPKSPATVANRTPTGVAVSPDGKSVYVGTESLNANLPDAVSQYDVGAGGKLSPKSPATVTTGYDGLPFGVAVSPDGQSVYVTDAAANHVVQYDVGAGGKLSPKSPAELETGVQPYDVAVSPAAPVPASKSQCKHGGWKQFGFKSQGRCIAFVHRGPRH